MGQSSTRAKSTLRSLCYKRRRQRNRSTHRLEERAYPAEPAEAVDSTGAGDAFAAGYLLGGPGLAVHAAARCVAQMGAMP